MTVSEAAQAAGHFIGNLDILWVAAGLATWFTLVALAVLEVGNAPPPRTWRPEPEPPALTPAQLDTIKNYRSPAGYRGGVKVE